MDNLIKFIKSIFAKKEESTNLATVLPAPPAPVIESVTATTPVSARYRKAKRPVDKLIIHCTASDYAHHDNVETIDKWHKEKGWSGIGYHYVILKDGSVKLGRDIDIVGAHCQGQNKGSIGIVLTGYKYFSHAQMISLKLLVGELCQMYNLKRSDVYPHSKFANKACPNFDIYEII